MSFEIYRDRVDAGRKLAAALERYAGPDTVVLGVPRGGVVVAAEVARALGAPLDVVLARKLGAPEQPELAIGAVISGDHGRLLDEAAVRYLQVPAEYIEYETQRQLEEIDRRVELYRGEQPGLDLRGKTVIVVDDGVATGYTARAALLGLRRLQPARIVMAVPVAPPATCAALRSAADEVVCLQTPEPFLAVGGWYENFDQGSDEEVAELLRAVASGD
jgi:putative phosphoribosyl transferase